MSDIGANIKKCRENVGLTQNELGQKINATQKVISAWENGRSEPSIDYIISISKVCRVSLDALILGETSDYSSEILTASEKALIKVWREADELRKMQAYAGLLVNPDYSFTPS